MWNDLYPERPSLDICEYKKKDKLILEQIPDLVNILTFSADMLTDEHPIWKEIYIFNNVQTKYKRILQCDKCLQHLKRVGGCLRKMVILNLSKIYLDLAEKFLCELQNINSGSSKSSCFLPSRQQLEFVLIRTQTAAKLICESLHYSRETFCYLIQRLKVGHMVLSLMMATSVTARLNIVFKGLLIQVCDAYKKLYVWREILKKGGYEWPKPLNLPENLKEWINLEESEHLKPRHLPKEGLDFLKSIFADDDQLNRPSFEDDNDVILLNDKNSNNELEPEKQEECIVIEDIIYDTGVPVSRSEVKNNGLEQSEYSSLEQLGDNGLEQEENNGLEQEEDNGLRQPENNNLDQLEENYLELSNMNTTTSSEKGTKTKKLTNAQKKLLKKIKTAQDLKGLKVIWDNLDVTSQDLLPSALTPVQIRLIDKVFIRYKRRLTQLNDAVLPPTEKEEEAKCIVQVAGLKFAKHLKLLISNKKNKEEKNSRVEINPVKTFPELRKLYETLYQRLQSKQKYGKCEKLKKAFKTRRADIKLLVTNKEKDSAKRLILNTSKYFINEFLK